MTKLAQKRITFIAQLHDAFFITKGHGAFAFISVSDAMKLFEMYLDSTEPEDRFIKQFVRSF